MYIKCNCTCTTYSFYKLSSLPMVKIWRGCFSPQSTPLNPPLIVLPHTMCGYSETQNDTAYIEPIFMFSINFYDTQVYSMIKCITFQCCGFWQDSHVYRFYNQTHPAHMWTRFKIQATPHHNWCLISTPTYIHQPKLYTLNLL